MSESNEVLDIFNISLSNSNENNLNLQLNLSKDESKEEKNSKNSFCKGILIQQNNEYINLENLMPIKNDLYYDKDENQYLENENNFYKKIKIINDAQIDDSIKEYKKEVIPVIQLGKKRKHSNVKEKHKKLFIDNIGRKKMHTKYDNDNVLRKMNHIILESLLSFINNKIKEIYNNDTGKGVFEKKLLKINYNQKKEVKIEYNQKFLNKSLGDIFSDNITKKYANYPLNHNKKVINELKNDEKFGNPNYFRNLFNLSFLQCFKHFRGDEIIPELEGLEGIKIVTDKFKDDKKYFNFLEYFIINFETIINNKKGKNIRRKKI